MLGDVSTRDPAVISSWRRCIDLHKLDPANRQAPYVVSIAPQPVSPTVRTPPSRRPSPLSELHGGDTAMLKVLQSASRLVESVVPVFIQGEADTGKRELARAMHESRTPNKPFLLLSCAGLTPEMLEQARPSNLPAMTNSSTLFARLGGGTLFLDEVSDLSVASHDTLLRLLVDFENDVLPATRVREVPRLLSSSRMSLAESVRDGRFCQDLFHRLVGATVALPAVRDREDFEWLLLWCFTYPPASVFMQLPLTVIWREAQCSTLPRTEK